MNASDWPNEIELTDEERDRAAATLILCGRIGYEDHLRMAIVKGVARATNSSPLEAIHLIAISFSAHCDCVRSWLASIGYDVPPREIIDPQTMRDRFLARLTSAPRTSS